MDHYSIDLQSLPDFNRIYEASLKPGDRRDKTLVREAANRGMSVDRLVKSLLYKTDVLPVPNDPRTTIWIPGHRIDARMAIDEKYLGPCKGIDLMIIGAYPEREDSSYNRHLRGDTGLLLLNTLEKFLGNDFYELVGPRIYYTTVGRFPTIDGEKKHKAGWATPGHELVRAEVETIKPRAILALGKYAAQALWGTKAKVTSMRGTTQEYEGIPVVVSTNPMQFMMGYAGIETFEREVRESLSIAFGEEGIAETFREDPADLDYHVARTASEFESVVDYILSQPGIKRLVFDCEWGNGCGRDEFGDTISVQVSWRSKAAAFFMLRRPGCENWEDSEIHTPEEKMRCRAALTRLLVSSPYPIGGQNVRVDVKELWEQHRIDLRPKLRSAYDSMLMNHLLHQDEDHGLDALTWKYCPEIDCYWSDLEDWLDKNTRSAMLRYGYARIPEEILVPYGLRDADVEFRVIERILEEWEKDDRADIRSLYWNVVIPANLPILEMEMTGLTLDLDRMDFMHAQFQSRYDEILEETRELLQFPTFNPGSAAQVAATLFSTTTYKNSAAQVAKIEAAFEDGDEPLLLDLDPVCNTDQYPKDWWLIVEEGQEQHHSPSTKAESLKIISSQLKGRISVVDAKLNERKGLIAERFNVDPEDPSMGAHLDNDEVYNKNIQLKQWLLFKKTITDNVHDLKILSQFLKNFLKLPSVSKDNIVLPHPVTKQPIVVHEDGKSFRECYSQIKRRVSGTILQTTGTGRARMFQANLMVFPKRQEKEIERIFKGRDIKIPKIKSCVIAGDHGDGEKWVITEADFKQAENWIMAIAGKDQRMLSILQAGRDLHSENCTTAFHVEIPGHWGWNGDDPEEGRPVSGLDADFEHVRKVEPNFERLLDDRGFKLPIVNGLLALDSAGDATFDYDVWASVIKGMYPDKRTAAKTISFGVPYGRGARALAREIRKAGVDITDEEAQRLVDSFYETYPGVASMLQTARNMAIDPLYEYVVTDFGRRRYFTGASRLSRLKQSSAQREAGNFPIQGCVADLLYQAMVKFYDFRHQTAIGKELGYMLLLPVHDALIFEHRERDTEQMHEIIKFCMSEDNYIPNTGGMRLGVDIETFERWGDSGTVIKRSSYLPQLPQLTAT